MLRLKLNHVSKRGYWSSVPSLQSPCAGTIVCPISSPCRCSPRLHANYLEKRKPPKREKVSMILRFWASMHWAVRRLTTSSREILKPGDSDFGICAFIYWAVRRLTTNSTDWEKGEIWASVNWSLRNLAGILAAKLPIHLSNFRTIRRCDIQYHCFETFWDFMLSRLVAYRIPGIKCMLYISDTHHSFIIVDADLKILCTPHHHAQCWW